MTIEDYRTNKELKCAVVAKDTFMGGWGCAKNGESLAAWVVDSSLNIDRVYDWVKNRSEMKRVRIVSNIDNYNPSGKVKHLSIYEVNEKHPAFK